MVQHYQVKLSISIYNDEVKTKQNVGLHSKGFRKDRWWCLMNLEKWHTLLKYSFRFFFVLWWGLPWGERKFYWEIQDYSAGTVKTYIKHVGLGNIFPCISGLWFCIYSFKSNQLCYKVSLGTGILTFSSPKLWGFDLVGRLARRMCPFAFQWTMALVFVFAVT